MESELKNILPLCQKPIRYTGGEYNCRFKERKDNSLLFGLIFPDVYEIGMSNYGLKILYHILNKEDAILAERIYAPWPDFGQRLKVKGIPLYSLESKTPLNKFHILGFSLQSELSYTNCLYCLDIAGIPLRSAERKNSDPLVIAGGPCSVNPRPMEDFIDAFVIGDGEEVVKEIADVYQNWDRKSRERLLSTLAQLEGVYVPLHPPASQSDEASKKSLIKKRTVSYLKEEDFPFPPLVPICEIVHDRLTVEVMRGCTRGCRFCQAGIINRPLRIRTPEEILCLVERGIRSSGWEELSLLAFSVADYPDLPSLLSQLNALLYKRRVGISLPSMRGEDFSLELAQTLKAIKKTGLTFAPETTSPRLKRLINKDVSEEKIFSAIAAAANAGWLGVKLYFMIGLPSETEEDIRSLSSFVGNLARQFKKIQIRVSFSSFIPKPHTPLQWKASEEKEVLTEKIEFLKRETKRRNIILKWDNPEQTEIQACLARGDERLGRVIETAYKKGAIFTEWSEFFNYKLWEASFLENDLDPKQYLREYSLKEKLPWDFIDVGVKKEFLRGEARKAEAFHFTPDCFQSATCSDCGACPNKIPLSLKKNYLPSREDGLVETPTTFTQKTLRPFPPANPETGPKITYRIKYAVLGSLAFASHLDIVRAFYRALRRSELPVAFSAGYSPHPLLSFSPPRPVGITSKGEYLDIQLLGFYSGNITRDLAPFLPRDIRILESRLIRKKANSLSQAINLAQYAIKLTPALVSLKERLMRSWQDIPGIQSLDFTQTELLIFITIAPGIRLFSVLGQLLGLEEGDLKLLEIERRDSYILRGARILSPLEDV